jgi:serine protease Do
MAGRVVGINTAIMSSGQGIGFAVPINLARGIIDQLRESGEVTRGWLGVAIQDLTPEMAEYYGIEVRSGVLVTDVFAGDPAAQGGILPRDVITSVNDLPVASTRELTRLIADIPVGDTARIDVVRNGVKQSLAVTIAKRDDTALAARTTDGGEMTDALGIRVNELNEEIAEQLNMAPGDGVIITGVKEGSSAASAGFRAGDIVKEINHDTIATVKDYHDRVARAPAGEAIFFFIRRAGEGFIVLKVAK